MFTPEPLSNIIDTFFNKRSPRPAPAPQPKPPVETTIRIRLSGKHLAKLLEGETLSFATSGTTIEIRKMSA